MALNETAKRYKAHNDAIERSQKNLSAPPGKKCIEDGCTNGAFPWDKRCRSCEKKHQRALRSANRKTALERDGGVFTSLVTRGGAR